MVSVVDDEDDGASEYDSQASARTAGGTATTPRLKTVTQVASLVKRLILSILNM
jgi:hypothetical protein